MRLPHPWLLQCATQAPALSRAGCFTHCSAAAPSWRSPHPPRLLLGWMGSLLLLLLVLLLQVGVLGGVGQRLALWPAPC
jgi:hypothetical protein